MPDHLPFLNVSQVASANSPWQGRNGRDFSLGGTSKPSRDTQRSLAAPAGSAPGIVIDLATRD